MHEFLRTVSDWRSYRSELAAAIACFLAIALPAAAQKVEITPAGAVSMDDVLVVRAGPFNTERVPHLETLNLTAIRNPERTANGWQWTFRATAPGLAHIGPFLDDAGATLLGDTRLVSIGAPPAIPVNDPPRALEMLRRAGLAAAYVHCDPTFGARIAGAPIVVTCSLLSDSTVFMNRVRSIKPPPAGARIEELPLDDFAAPIPGVTRKILRRFAVTASGPGMFVIPSLEVELTSSAPRPAPDPLSGRCIVRRATPEVVLHASARPPSAEAVADNARLFESGRSESTAGSTFTVTLAGSGDVRDTPPPRFATDPPPDVIITTRELSADVTRTVNGLASKKSWELRLDATEKPIDQLPPLELSVAGFDGRVSTLTHTLEKVSLRPRNWRLPESARRPPPSSGPKFRERARAIGDRVVPLILIVIVVWLLRVVRRIKTG